MVQGEIQGGIFVARLVGQPLAESRDSFLEKFPAYWPQTPSDATIVTVSDVWLDVDQVCSRLQSMFQGFCASSLPDAFVLIGNFHSEPLDSQATNMDSYLQGFDRLADIIQSLPDLGQTQIILIPGPNDPFESGILPRKPISGRFTKSLQKIANVTMGSNPCHISIHGSEVLIYREDLLSKLQRLAVIPVDEDSMENLYEVYVQTILNQGHLSPLPLNESPVYWNYDHTLHLNPLPDLVSLILCCE